MAAEEQLGAVEDGIDKVPGLGKLVEVGVEDERVRERLDQLRPVGRVVSKGVRHELHIAVAVGETMVQHVFNFDSYIADILASRSNFDPNNIDLRRGGDLAVVFGIEIDGTARIDENGVIRRFTTFIKDPDEGFNIVEAGGDEGSFGGSHSHGQAELCRVESGDITFVKYGSDGVLVAVHCYQERTIAGTRWVQEEYLAVPGTGRVGAPISKSVLKGKPVIQLQAGETHAVHMSPGSVMHVENTQGQAVMDRTLSEGLDRDIALVVTRHGGYEESDARAARRASRNNRRPLGRHSSRF